VQQYTAGAVEIFVVCTQRISHESMVKELWKSVGPHLVKLLSNIKWLPFYGHSVLVYVVWFLAYFQFTYVIVYP